MLILLAVYKDKGDIKGIKYIDDETLQVYTSLLPFKLSTNVKANFLVLFNNVVLNRGALKDVIVLDMNNNVLENAGLIYLGNDDRHEDILMVCNYLGHYTGYTLGQIKDMCKEGCKIYNLSLAASFRQGKGILKKKKGEKFT
ncbi:hypothetical protein D3C81_07000 [compost metagenome]